MPIHSSSLGRLKAYTPTWTSAGTAPALGNGSLTGWYLLVGEFLFVQIDLLMGSSTTYGTGQYYWSLPTGVAVAEMGVGSATAHWQPGAAVAVDSGTAYRHGTATFFSALTSDPNRCCVVGQGIVGYWTPTVPHTWANTDELNINGFCKVIAR